jgi:CRP-like cAMP-binding protein
MSNVTESREKLKDTVLFAEFSSEEFDQLFELFDEIRVAQGEIIVRQDDSGDCMFILMEGSARVIHRKDGREFLLATMQPGDFFGELALVDAGPRSADVVATTDCALLKITQAMISAAAGVYPTAAFKLLIAIGRVLVDRLRKSNQRYVDSLLFPTAGKD